MKKKILALLLSLIMIVSVMPMSVFAGEGGETPSGNVAKVGNTEYATIEEALAAWGAGKTLTLLADVTTSETKKVTVTRNSGNWTLNLGDYTWTTNNCNAIQLFATGGTAIDMNQGLTINANAGGGINAGNKYCVEYKNDSDVGSIDKGYRPFLKINGGTYTGSYIHYYTTSAWSSDPTGAATTISKGADGSIPVINGKLALGKCIANFNAGIYNGDINVYVVTSTSDVNIYAGCKFVSLPKNGNDKIVHYDSRVLYNDGEYWNVLSSVPETYGAKVSSANIYGGVKATSPKGSSGNLITSKSGYTNPYVYFADPNLPITAGFSTVILGANAVATAAKSIGNYSTFTLDATAQGANYTGTVTLSGIYATFVVSGAFSGKVVSGVTGYSPVVATEGNTKTYTLKQDGQIQGVAEVDGAVVTDLEAKIQDIVESAGEGSTVKLRGNTAEDIEVPVGVTIDTDGKETGEISAPEGVLIKVATDENGKETKYTGVADEKVTSGTYMSEPTNVKPGYNVKETGTDRYTVSSNIVTEGNQEIMPDGEQVDGNVKSGLSEEAGDDKKTAAVEIISALSGAGTSSSKVVDLSKDVENILNDLDLDKVKDIAQENNTLSQVNELLNKADEANEDGKNVDIKIDVKGKTNITVKDTGDVNGGKYLTFLVDIEPVYTMTLTTTVEGEEPETVVFASEKPFDLDGTLKEILIPKPEGFAHTPGNTIIINHYHVDELGNKTLVDQTTATYDAVKNEIKFPNTYGFSDFEVIEHPHEPGEVATILRDGDYKPYNTLQAAFLDAKNGETVIMLEDVELGNISYKETYIDRNIVFNLGGHKLSGTNPDGILGVLGNVIIENGTIENLAQGFTVNAVVIGGGCITVRENVKFVINVANATKFAINDVGSSDVVLASDDGEYAGRIKAFDVTIKGGVFNGEVNPTNSLTISGGTFNGDITLQNQGDCAITGGTFNGSVSVPNASVSGGRFKTKLAQTKLADDKCWSELRADGYYYVVPAVAEYNGVRYESVAAAVKYAGYNNAKAIKLLANTSHYFDPAVIASGNYIALNVNGFNFTPTCPAGFEVVNENGKYSLKLLAPTVDDDEIGDVYSGAAFTSTASSVAAGATFKWFNGENLKAEEATLSVTNVAETGTYTVKAYAGNGYESAGTTVTVAITKADYDMSGVTFTDDSKSYTGTEQSLVVGGTLPTGADDIQVTVSYSAGRTNVGDIEITATFATTSGNYNVPEAKTAKLTITKVDATITPNAASKIAGNDDPALTATVTGTVNDEVLTYTVKRVAGDTEGTYTISVTVDENAAVNKNYNITTSTATFTISASAAKVKHGEAETYFDTLQAAYNAAADGDTLTLLIDTNSFPTIKKGITVDFGEKVVNGKVTVDAAGKTVTFKGTTGGIQPTSGSAINVKNGDLVINSGVYTSTNSALIVDEYGTKSLTVNGGTLTANFGTDYTNSWARFIYDFDGNVTLNGGNLTFNVENPSTYYAYFIEIDGNDNTVEVKDGAHVVINSKDRATFVCGDPADVNIKGGTIESNGASRNTLVDDGKNVKIENVNYKATGTVTNYIIDGATKTEVSGGTFDITPNYDTWGKPIEVFGCADTEVSGGTFTVPVSPEKCANGFAPDTYVDEQTGKVTYGVEESPNPIVAKITGSNNVVYYYTSLEEAIVAVTKDQVIELTADIVLDKTLEITKYVKIESRAHNVSTTVANQKLFKITNNGTLYIDANYGTPSTFTGRFDVGAANNDNGNLILYFGNYTVSDNTVIHVNGTCDNCKLQILNAKVTSTNDNAIQMNGGGTLRIANSTVTGATGVYMKAGTLNFESGTIKGNGAYNATIPNHNGSDATGDAIVLDAQDGYKGQINVNITASNNVTITSVNGSAIREAVTEGNNSATVSLKISNSKATLTAATGKDAIKVSDKFVAAVKAGTATSAISAGTYSSDVPAVLCSGLYRATKQENGTYVVGEKTAVAEVNGKQYTTFKEALEAANEATGDVVIKILVAEITVSPAFTVYLNNNTTVMTELENGTAINLAGSNIEAYSPAKNLVIGENVTMTNHGQTIASKNFDIYGTLYSSQFWAYNGGTVNVKPGGVVNMAYGDGMIKMRYDSTVNIEGTLTSGQAATAEISSLAASMKQMGGGYVSADYDGIKNINIKNAYASTGRLGGSGTGKVITTLDNAIFELDNPYNGVCYSTTGEAGELILKNGSRMIVKGGISFDNNDSATIEAGSIIEATTLTNDGKIIIDARNATADKYTIIDYTGNDTMELADYGKIEVNGEYAVKVEGNDLVIYKAVAKITVGGTTTYYATLAEAVAAAVSGQTITLLDDVTINEIVINKAVVIDLNGKTVTTNGCSAFAIENGSLELKGSGVVTGTPANSKLIWLKGSTDSTAENYSNLIIGKDVTVGGEGEYYAVMVSQNAGCGYGVNITINGTVTSDYGVYVNGSIVKTEGNVPNITVNDGATVGGGVYAAGYAKWTINGGDFTHKDCPFEIRAGELTINGGTFTAEATEFVAEPNDNGSTISGAALAISQHSTNLPVIVTINGGTFNGAKAVYENDLQDTDPTGVTIVDISSGEFNGSVETENCKNFISGGTFTEKPAANLFAEGYAPVEDANDNWVAGVCNVTITREGVKYNYNTLAEAAEAAKDGDVVTILKDCSADGLAINATIQVDLNGKTVTLGVASIAAGDKVTIIDNAETKGKLICTGAITVNGTLDVSALGYGTTGLVASQSGSLAIGSTGNVALMSAWDSYTAAWLDANSSTFFAGTANGAQIVTSGGSARFVRVGDRWQVPGAVAQIKRSIGGKEYYDTYATLADAVADAKNGETIVMIANETIEGNAGVTVAAGQNIVLDLNGKTISNLVTVASASQVITNNGTLTIMDSSSPSAGKITNSCTEGLQGNWEANNWVTNIVTNKGTLNVNGGTLENTASGNICYAVDCYGGSTLNVSGGTLKSGYIPVRTYTSAPNSITINVTGGQFDGLYNFYIQNGNQVDIDIEDGTFNAPTRGIFYIESSNADIDVSGGEFNYDGEHYGCFIPDSPSVTPEVAVSGGTYSSKVPLEYCADGFRPGECGDDGKYSVSEGTAVASITTGSNTVYYASLAAAVKAAETGDTIELLADCSGNGIALMAADAKTITIDLNNHKYTVNGELVGSTGTKSQAFHFEKGNTVTIKNGTLATTNARMFMQNYADLTLDGVTLDGTGLQGSGRYVLSNNSGDVTIKDTKITAKTGDYALDTCKFGSYDIPTVTVEGTSEINGNVSLDGGSLELISGTLNGELKATENVFADNNTSVTKAAGFTAAAPEGYAWNSEGQLVDAVAKITVDETTTYYATLAEAIAAASEGKTITLLADLADQGAISLPAGVTLDGNGHKLSGDTSVYINAAGGTVENVVFENIHGSNLSAIYASGLTGEATITGCTFNGWDWDAIQCTPVEGAEVCITGNTFNATSGAKRAVHVQAGSVFSTVDFTATVTGNKFNDCSKLSAEAIGVYYIKDENNLAASGNYIDNGSIWLGKNSGTDLFLKALPLMDETLTNELSVVAYCGTKFYTDIDEAFAALSPNGTLTLLANVTVHGTKVIDINTGYMNDSVTVNLNGFNIDGGNERVFHVKCGKLTLNGNGIISSNPAQSSSVIRVGDNAATTNARLDIYSGVTVSTQTAYAVTAFGTMTETVNVYGTVTSTAPANKDYDGSAIATNGLDTTPATILVSGGAEVSATNTNAIYLPSGKLTVQGDATTVTGTTGIYVKGGTVAIKGGTITGTGDKQAYQYYGNGGISTGDALVIDNCGYPTDITSVAITGGIFVSTNGVQVGAYYGNTKTEIANITSTNRELTAPAGYVWNADGKLVLAEAKITRSGVDTYYETFANAVAAAEDSDVITLLEDASGNGITIDKSITIDLGGKTYTVNGNLAGSTGTKTQAFQLLKGNDITIKNGTITTTVEANAALLIQNYSNLTLDNVNLYGSNLRETREGRVPYTLSINNGNVVLENGTTITASTQAGSFAYDLYDWAPNYSGITMEIGEGVTISGNVEVGGTRDVLNIKVDVPADKMPDAPAWYAWDESGKLIKAVAMIGEGDGAEFFATLADAVKAAETDDTIKLLADAKGAGLFIEKTQDNLTLNLNGMTYTVTSPAVGSTGTETQALHIEAPRFKLIGGKLTSEGEAVKMLVQNYSNLTVENVTLDGSNLPGSGRYVLSNNSGTVEVKNSTIKAKFGDFAMDTCKFGSYDAPAVTLTGNTKLEGDVELSGGKLTIPAETTVEINGSFKQVPGYTKGDVSISSGSFKDQVKLEYCADNFVPTVQNEETGMYSVEQTTKDIVARIIAKDKDIQYFTTLQGEQGAIAAAGNGDTIQLLVDLTEESQGVIIIQPGITLDLNGHDIRANMVLVFGAIKDDGETKGKLIVAQNSFAYMGGCELTMDKDNCPVAYESVIPVWTVANGDDLAGYVFYNITKFDRVWSEKLDTDHPIFTFAPRSENIANILDENSGVELYVYISYSSDGENYQGMHITIGRELISTYLNDPVGTAISVSFSGVGNITEMRAYAYLKSSQCNFIIKSKTSITTTLN